jgi:gliding motility-associated-like protein
VTTDNNGCQEQLQLTIQEPVRLEVALVALNAPVDNTIALGDSVQLSALITGGGVLSSIVWSPQEGADGSLSVWVSPTLSSRYQVVVTDVNGCRAESDISIQVDRTRKWYIPNAFSPNDDGINDRFMLFAKAGQIRDIRYLRVYDRWGGIVYAQENLSANDLTRGWDGMRNGQPLDTGVYVYFAEIEYTDGERELVKGEVILMR